MITRLCNLNRISFDSIDQTMLISNPTGPISAQCMLQWFRLSDPFI